MQLFRIVLYRNKDKARDNQSRGFTLIELLFVIIIIGTLVALVFPRFAERSKVAKMEATRAFIKVQLATALREYEMDNGRFPTTREGLIALLKKPQGARNWRGPYLNRKPIDPWGKDYQYLSPGDMQPRSYDLFSLGPDKRVGKDDIANWQE